MYWRFLLTLLVASFLMPFAYSLLTLPSTGIGLLVVRFGFTANGERRIPFFLWPFLLMGMVWTFLVFALWAGYCAWVTTQTVALPSVTHDWLYYVTAFSLLVGPIRYMAAKEETLTPKTERPKSGYRAYPVILVSTAYVAFCIWPSLMSPGKFILGWLGPRIEESKNADASEKSTDLACPPNDYIYVQHTKCNPSPDSFPAGYFSNSGVTTKLACYNPTTGKLAPDDFEQFSGRLRECPKGELMVKKK